MKINGKGMPMKEAVCVIPAGGDSKGIPGKCLMDFCGKPLIAWSILQAQQAKSVNGVYVSSDDDAVLRIAEDFGATPIRYADRLSVDAPTLEAVLMHAINHIEKERSEKIDVVLFLHPASPLREAEDIDGAVKKLTDDNADSLFSSARFADSFVWMQTEKGLECINFTCNRSFRQQDVKPRYLENGSIYLFKPEIVRTTNNHLGGRIATYEMEFWKASRIDTQQDKAFWELFFKTRLTERFVDLSPDAIDLIVYDFDGVMTDNRVLTLQDGTEAVFANRSDGFAVRRMNEMGIKQVIISTETNPVIKARAEKIGIPCLQGIGNKLTILKKYISENNIDKGKVVFIGNEINDVEAMSYVGLPVAPADAYPEVKDMAMIVLKARGGKGVVREFFSLIKGNGII